jgi:pSer/pThr/pTyr-binding forkhead associated (FHA) protein
MMELVFTKGPKAGERFALSAERVSIGRLSECEIKLDQPNVSRQHAFIKRERDRVLIMDNRSGNGTFVNGKRITRAALRDGDQVRIGAHTMRVTIGAAEAPPDERPTRPDSLSRFLIEDRTGATRRLEFAGHSLTIGRGEKCQLALDDAQISRTQAKLRFRNGRFELKDAGSVNGTYLNGRRVNEAEIQSGDCIEMGDLLLAARVANGALHLVIKRRPATGATLEPAASESAPLPPSPPAASPREGQPRPRYTIIGGLAIALAVALLLIFVGRAYGSSCEPVRVGGRAGILTSHGGAVYSSLALGAPFRVKGAH